MKKIKIDKSKHGSIIKISLIIIGIMVVLYLVYPKYQMQKIDGFNNTSAFFECPDGKTISAAFSGDIVDLDLSDGTQAVLDRAVSANGVRYTNADGSMVFWNEGKKASIQVNNTIIYRNCEVK